MSIVAAHGVQRAVRVLHGRDLDRALEFALSGPRSPWFSSAIAIGGGAGAGRSTFVDRLTKTLTGLGYLTLQAAPCPHDTRIPHATLDDLLSGCAGAGGGPGEPAAARRSAIEAVGLARAVQPVVIAVDDTANADAASRAVVCALLRQHGCHPLLLILSHPEWPGRGPEIEGLVSALRRHGAVRTVVLGPADTVETTALIEQVGLAPPGQFLAERIGTEAGGHPLLVDAIAREALGDHQDPARLAATGFEFSPGAAERVLARLFGNRDELRAVAAGVAFLGGLRPGRLELLAAVVAWPTDQVCTGLDALTRVGLLRLVDGGYFGRAPLLDRTLIASLSPGTTWLWHTRAADWLGDSRDPADAADLAEHLLPIARHGGERAIADLIDAAESACDAEPARCALWYQAALALMSESDPLRGRAYSGLARASCLTGDMAAAVDAGRLALNLLAPGPDRERMLRLVSEAGVLGQGSLEYLNLPGEQQTPYLLSLSAHLLARSGRLVEAAQAVRLADEMLPAESPGGQTRCLTHIAHAHGLLGQAAAMLAVTDRALAAAPASALGQISTFVNCAYLLAMHGCDEASGIIARCHQLARQSPCELGRTELALAELVDDYRTGRWAQLLAASAELKTLLARNDADSGLAVVEALEADVLGHRGMWRAAARALAGRACCASSESLRAWAAAGIDLASGDSVSALARLDAALSGAQVPKFREFLLVRRAQAQLATGDVRAARDTAAAVAPATLDRATTLAGLDATRLCGILGRDPDLLAQCLDHASQRRAALLGGRIRLDLAELGVRPEEHLRAAYEVFHALGADPWRRQAARQLRRGGFKVPRYRAPRPAGLTDTELQVARMVQQGRRNREIAAALSMSIKTVESYLTRVYAKTSCSSRLELARVLDERD